VELRERHLDYWTPYSDIRSQESNNKRSTYHQWCALPTKRRLVSQSLYTLPTRMHLVDACFLIFLVTLFAAWLASDFVPTLRIETVTWTHNTSPTCVMLMMHKMSNTSIFTAPIHTWSLSKRNYASLFPSAGFNNVSAFLGQENNKLYFFLHALTYFYEHFLIQFKLRAFFL